MLACHVTNIKPESPTVPIRRNKKISTNKQTIKQANKKKKIFSPKFFFFKKKRKKLPKG